MCTEGSCPAGEFCTAVLTYDPTYDGACCEDVCYECVPCSLTSGSVCDYKGGVYANQCSALDAGQTFFAPCAPPGTVACFGSMYAPLFCNTSTEVCVRGDNNDCGGEAPPSCVPIAVDGGSPDGGDGG
jgi:hypothetical protein